MKILLQPCGNINAQKHYKNTIEGMKWNIDSLKDYITNEQYKELLEIYPTKHCMIWGISSTSKNKWNKISKGDITLFSGKNKFFSAATVTYKIFNIELAHKLWGQNNDGSSWECIYFLDELHALDIPYLKINQLLGYSKKNTFRNFNILNEEKSNKIINEFSLNSDRYISDDIDYNEYTNIIDEQITNNLKNCNELETKRTTTQRKEQTFLRKYLFQNKFTSKCSICGKELPIEFLWCAHIKKRELCTKEEKLDYQNIVTPMCKLGCDDLYEKGYIGVRDGIVVILKHSENVHINNYLKSLENKKCFNYHPDSQKYYDVHNNMDTIIEK